MFDDASHLTDVTDDAADYAFEYEGMGRTTSITADLSGLTHSIIKAQTFDAASNITQLAATIDRFADLAGTNLAVTSTYGYDNANRLTSLYHTQNNTDLASYDHEGNRTRKTKISDGCYTDYVWDYRNRLIEVIDKTSGGTVTQDVLYVYEFRLSTFPGGAVEIRATSRGN